MSASGRLYIDELSKRDDLIQELAEALETLSAAILKNTNGMPDWLSRAMDASDAAIAKVRQS